MFNHSSAWSSYNPLYLYPQRVQSLKCYGNVHSFERSSVLAALVANYLVLAHHLQERLFVIIELGLKRIALPLSE